MARIGYSDHRQLGLVVNVSQEVLIVVNLAGIATDHENELGCIEHNIVLDSVQSNGGIEHTHLGGNVVDSHKRRLALRSFHCGARVHQIRLFTCIDSTCTGALNRTTFSDAPSK